MIKNTTDGCLPIMQICPRHGMDGERRGEERREENG
jgi:hypothetical protein